MENYKVLVKDEAESEEAQELFFDLGYVWADTKCKTIMKYKDPCYYSSFDDGDLCCDLSDVNHKHKEINLPQLRDLVVLRRNCVEDKNIKDNTFHDLYQDSKGIVYFYHHGKAKWIESKINGNEKYMSNLKPITKEECMKEYLTKMQDGSYKLIPSKMSDDDIEVPEGAEVFMTGFNTDRGCAFYKDDFNMVHGDNWKWESCRKVDISDHAKAVWQREPIDKNEQVLKEILEGEPNQKTIDAMDEADQIFADADAFVESNVEQGVKHSHYKKDVSHLELVDIYRLTELFKPHSCGAHIAKKALCSGDRGHKDLLTDIQDIIDTAERWKEMLIEDENSCKD